MEDNNGEIVVGEANNEGRGTRKRQKNPSTRQISKRVRLGTLIFYNLFCTDNVVFTNRYACHLPSTDEFEKPCKHAGAFDCAEITTKDIVAARQNFFKIPDKAKQDVQISHLMHILTPKRRRPKPQAVKKVFSSVRG